MEQVSIILPIYNEAQILEKNLEKIINRLKKSKIDYEIILAEDGSTDGTDKIATSIAKSSKKIIHLHFDKRLGRGQALSNGIKKSKNNIVAYMDIDLAVDLKYLDDMLAGIKEGYDIVTGSRMVKGASVKRPLRRELASRAYNYLTRFLFRDGIKDHQCGFKAFNKKKILKIIDNIENKHWFWDTEFLIRSHLAGLKIKEIPVEWKEKKQSGSKVKVMDDSVNMGSKLLKFRWNLLSKDKITVLFITYLLLYSFGMLFLIPNNTVSWDEGMHTLGGLFLHRLIDQLPSSLSYNWIQSFFSHYWVVLGSLFWHPPFFKVLSALSFGLFGISELVIRAQSLFFIILSTIMSFVLASKIFNKKVGLISSIFLSTSQIAVFVGTRALVDGVLLFFVLLSIYMIYRINDGVSTRRTLIYALIFGIGILNKYQLLVIIALYYFFLILLRRKPREMIQKNIILFFGIGIITLVLWFGFIYLLSNLANNPTVKNEFLTYILIWTYGPLEWHLGTDPAWNELGAWYYYFFEIPNQVTFLLIPLILAGLYLSKDSKKRHILWSWLLAVYLIFSVVHNKDVRYSFPWIPALCMLAALPLSRIYEYSRPYAKHLSVLFFIALVSANLWSASQIYTAWADSEHYKQPFQSTVSYLVDNLEPGKGVIPVSHSDFFNIQSFCFYMLAADVELKYSCVWPPENLNEEGISQFYDDIDRMNISYIVLSPKDKNAIYQHVSTSGNFSCDNSFTTLDNEILLCEVKN